MAGDSSGGRHRKVIQGCPVALSEGKGSVWQGSGVVAGFDR